MESDILVPGAESQEPSGVGRPPGPLVDRLANVLMDKRGEVISKAIESLLDVIVREVVMPEYVYWQDCPDDFGATGALANVLARLKGFDLPGRNEEAVWRRELRGAMAQAEANVELHIGRDVYEKHTARGVVADFKEQLAGVLGLNAETQRAQRSESEVRG